MSFPTGTGDRPGRHTDPAAAKVRDAFARVSELPPRARAEALDKMDLSESDRLEVEALVRTLDTHPGLSELPESGERLGPYELGRELGRGSMGIVYAAFDSKLGRQVAIKRLPRHSARDPLAQERLRREAQSLASVHHPNIATLFDAELEGDEPFLVMERVEGEDLAHRLQQGPLTQDETVDVARSVLNALVAAHAKDIIHRDLKPSNITRSFQGTIKVLDFGLAKLVAPSPGEASESGLTHPGTRPGTPDYMSPEQRTGSTLDPRTDFWSLGVTLVECLLGSDTFQNQVASIIPPSGAALRSFIPVRTDRRLRRLLERCLTDDRSQRLANAVEGLTLLAPTPRRSTARSFGVAAIVSVVAVAAFLLWRTLLPEPTVVSVRIDDDHVITATDESGQSVWSRRFESPIRGDAVTSGLHTLADPSGRVEGALVVTQPPSTNGELHYLDSRGNRVWTQETRLEHLPLNFHGPLYVVQRATVSWPGRPDPVLVTQVADDAWYPCALVFQTFEPEVLGTYYHPGPVNLVGEYDFDGDGIPTYLFVGANSSARFMEEAVPFKTDFHCGVLFQLDPPDVNGQAYPYSRSASPDKRDWPGVERANERNYLLVPPIDDKWNANVWGPSVSAEPEWRIRVSTHDGRMIELDSELRPLSVYIPVDCHARDLLEAGELKNLPFLHLSQGGENREFIDVPVIH